MAYAPVSAVLKGLKVLEAVNRLGPASLREITEVTGLPKASTVRLLETLVHAGYISVMNDARRYIVTARVLSLSNNFRPDQALLAVAAPVLKTLREKTGWPSDLALYQHGKMVIADTNRQPGTFSINRSVGSRVPMTSTALGRAYLAFCPDAERAAILDLLAPLQEPDEALADSRDKLEKLIKKVRKQGYATSNQELMKTIRAVAVPVRHDDQVVCCFNIIVPAQVMSLTELEQKYVPLLTAAARDIEQRHRG